MEMRELENLEAEISKLEQKKQQINASFDGVSDFEKISELSKAQKEVECLLEEKEMRYLELMEKLETLNHTA